MNKRLRHLITLVISLAFLVTASTTALGEEYYKGKNIRFVVGYSPGGGYDTYTRAIARHIGKYIPGNPTPIVQNMTGGGSLISANYTFNRAKPDGLTVGVFGSGLILQQALGDSKAKFTGAKFGWIGAPVKGIPACAIMGFTGLKSLKDILNSKKPVKIGATRAGSTTNDLPTILNKTLGTKFKVISGYKGSGPIRLAMQKKEVDGVCFTWESMRVNKLAIFRAWLAPYEFMRPLALPPGTPKARQDTLRKALKKTIEDPAFLAEAKKSKLMIRYVSGEEIEKHVAQIAGTPAKAKEGLQFLVRKKKKK
jgi:tripartite-type tricarboxylate transporter receptor subunit TctC